jgi:hypothetical protein
MDNHKQKPWYKLNINIDNAIQPDFNFNQLWNESVFKHKSEGRSGGLWCFPRNEKLKLVTAEWLSYMESLDLEVGSILLFYREPYFIQPETHVDIYNMEDGGHEFGNYALNWVVDPADNSEMIWYKWPEQDGTLTRLQDSSNLPYYHWPNSEFVDKEIARHIIGREFTLVNVGIPHNIMTKSVPRWCVSVRMWRKSKPISNWTDAVEYFKPFIKE